jgi:hypothetical protein
MQKIIVPGFFVGMSQTGLNQEEKLQAKVLRREEPAWFLRKMP